MSLDELVARGVVPFLTGLGALSLRWGVLILAIALWFRFLPPRSSVARHFVLLAAWLAGPLLPLAPALIVTRPAPPEPASVPPSPIFESPPNPVVPTSPVSVSAPLPVEKAPAASARRLSAREVGWIGLAVVWAGGAIRSSVGLAFGIRALRRLRRSSTPLDPESRRQFESCRAEIGLRRRASLASHPRARSPLVLGGLRPMVLVPPSWPSLPEPERRACLLHELTHLARRDDLLRLIREILRAPFFFHPLVNWLANRLDAEAERICDLGAISRGVDPRDFAELLLRFARGGGRLDRRGGLAPAFFSRAGAPERITRLMEDDMIRERMSVSFRDRAGFLLLVAALAVPIGGLTVVAARPATPGSDAAPAPAGPTPASRSLKGSVFDVSARPVAGARVLARFACPTTGRVFVQERTTDENGRYSFDAPNQLLDYRIVADKAGFAAESDQGYIRPFVDVERRHLLMLKSPVPFEIVLVDADGRPVAGARARIVATARTIETHRGPAVFREGKFVSDDSPLPPGAKTISTCYTYFFPRDAEPGLFEGRLTAVSDGDGRLRFEATPRDAWLKLAVDAPDGRSLVFRSSTWPEWKVVESADGRPVSVSSTMRGKPAAPRGLEGFIPPSLANGGKATVVPAATVVGRLTSKVPGVSVANRALFFQATTATVSNLTGRTTTDAEGRFKLEGLYPGKVNLTPDIARDEPLTCRAAANLALTFGSVVEANLELESGVVIEGGVRSKEGTPIPGARIGCHGPHRPASGADVTAATTDEAGRYRLRVPSGEVMLYVMSPGLGFAQARDQYRRTVDVPEGTDRFEGPVFELDRLP